MIRSRSLLFVLALSACAHKPPPRSETASSSSGGSHGGAGQAAAGASSEQTCSTDLDCGSKQLCIRNHCVDITSDLAECSQLRVHFPLNSAELDPADRSGLDRSARCLKADHAMHVTIEGNADERGTEEYNLALGDKRATGVAKYLESVGVSQTQLKTVSYGKENPLCTESDEACWAKNRRAELKPSEPTSKSKKKK